MRCLAQRLVATSFAEEYTSHKVKDFVAEIENLSHTTERYPQSVYAALIHCITGKWRYIMRTIEDIDVIPAIRRCDYSNIILFQH